MNCQLALRLWKFIILIKLNVRYAAKLSNYLKLLDIIRNVENPLLI